MDKLPKRILFFQSTTNPLFKGGDGSGWFSPENGVSAFKNAEFKHVNPLEMKKALSEDKACLLVKHHAVKNINNDIPRHEPAPIQKGLPFNSTLAFAKGKILRKSFDSNRETGFKSNNTIIFFFKSTPIPEGAHWLTVHPHGDGKGQPVLVQPVEPGSKTVHVIGGAGGSLNYLKFTPTKNKADYAKESAERAKQRRIAAAEQKKKDAELGVTGIKKEAKEELAVKKKAVEHDFIKTVADAMGWDHDSLAFDENAHSDISEEARNEAAKNHHQTLLKRCKEAVGLQRKRLLIDADARREAFTGDVPLHTDDTTKLSVADLDPVRSTTSLGFDPAYKERAENAGLTQEDIQEQKDAVVALKDTDEVQTPDVSPPKTPKLKDKIKAELEKVNADKPSLPARIVDVHKAVALLKAQKKLSLIQQSVKNLNKQIQQSIEPKAFVLDSSEVSNVDIEKSIADDLRTIKTSAFLNAVSENAPESQKIEHHVSAGAFNSINALSLAASGDALVDRSVVDVLGTAAASQILVRRFRSDLGDEKLDEIADNMGAYHIAHYEDLSTSALADVAELHEQAKEFELGAAGDCDDILVKSELNKKRMGALADAQKVLGRSLGEMEANASLVMAMKEKGRDSVQVSLGKTPVENAIKQLAAIGLKKEDYTIEKGGVNHFVTINATGMDKLAAPVDKENVERIRRNLGIMNGGSDEDGWLPEGFANRADLALNLQPGVADSMAEPFEPSENLEESLKNYIGSRAADGDSPADIVADLQSADFFQKVGVERSAEYLAALDKVAPNKDANGKQMLRAEELAPLFHQYADDFVASKWGGTRSALNSQTFDIDDIAQDALHRALSSEPAGTAAYKQIGDLHDGDMRALRDYFNKNIAKESPEHAELRASLEKHLTQEPNKTIEDMFGEVTPNPNHQAWESARNELAEKIKSTGLSWPDYVKTMRSPSAAYSAMQDLVRSKISSEFANHYNKLNPSKPLKIGKTVIRGNLNHLDAVDPSAREARVKAEKELVDSLRERSGGKYASGSVKQKMDKGKEQKAAFEQSQMGFFSSEELSHNHQKEASSLKQDERHTIGQAAENKIAAMMGTVGKNFIPGQPVKLFHASMSGPSGVSRQRAIKFAMENKRSVMGLGVGSGKSGIGLGAFAHLKSTGKIKKGIFIVPSIVQGQFGAEALRFMKPGQFNWHCQPGASHDERLASYKDKNVDFHVVTHQSFRDDLLKMAAKQTNLSPDDVAEKLANMSSNERAKFMKETLDKEGINFDFAMADEAHGLLNREGKDNSRMSNLIQGVTDNLDYYMHASGDLVKNDVSEAFDLLSKMDSKRYNDRSAFMRRYGGDSIYAKEGLRRELARHAYTAQISPDVNVSKHIRNVELTNSQKAAIDAVERNVAAVRIAKMQGKVDIPALMALSPESFAGVDKSQHEAIAQSLTKAVGVMSESAINRVINAHPDSGKLQDISKIANENKGRPGVVFARSLAAVSQIKSKLESEGHRVIVISGADSSKDKAQKIRAFNPDSGERKADIIICSDAGATGANLQSGNWRAHYDIPMTAMTHQQRNGRINRVGQKNDVDLYDLVANHPSERRARDRLARKTDLRSATTSPLDGLDDTGLASFLFNKNKVNSQDYLF